MNTVTNNPLTRGRLARAGMSLIEVIIALAMLFVVIGMAMEVVISTYTTTAMTEAKDRLNREAVDVINRMSDDIAESTWLYFDTSVIPTVLDTTTTALQASTDDATKQYYPYIQLQDNGAATGGMGPDFDHTIRAASMVALPALPLNLPGSALNAGNPAADATTLFTSVNRQDYLSSYWARSQEPLFVRLTASTWTKQPSAENPPPLQFPEAGDWSGTDLSAANHTAMGVLFPSAWTEVLDVGGNIIGYDPRQPNPLLPPYGRRLTATEVQMVNNEAQIRPSYQTADTPDNDPLVDQYPREYTYAVVPSPMGGLGRLVRAYSVLMSDLTVPHVSGTDPGQFITPIPTANTYGMRVDRVLSDNCVRIVFDTSRTEPRIAGQAGLGVYDVRVRLYMARRSSANSDLVFYRIIEAVLTMRGRTGEVDRANDSVKIGTPLDLTY